MPKIAFSLEAGLSYTCV